MVGEPEIEALGMAGRQAMPALDQAGRLGARPALERKMRLGRGNAGRNAAQRRHDDTMAEAPQQAGQPARHLAIA
jgi:hypothetical protein